MQYLSSLSWLLSTSICFSFLPLTGVSASAALLTAEGGGSGFPGMLTVGILDHSRGRQKTSRTKQNQAKARGRINQAVILTIALLYRKRFATLATRQGTHPGYEQISGILAAPCEQLSSYIDYKFNGFLRGSQPKGAPLSPSANRPIAHLPAFQHKV